MSGPTIYGGGYVAPFAGAWIEMGEAVISNSVLVSLPSRERGLKYCFCKVD